MKWMTLWNRSRSELQIDPGDSIVCLGSCFAEHVARRLERHKCKVTLNPSGILYNPFSIAKNTLAWLDNRENGDRIVNRDELFHSMDHHGSFSSLTREGLHEKIAASDKLASRALKEADIAIITFGTAWVYRWKEDEGIAANCHKIPADEFNKELLSIDDIVVQWSRLIEKWSTVNPDLQLIFSVSPVRHVKDGLVENQRSKATLVLAIHELLQQHKNTFYFPSYEIVIDELRDYRFFTEDLVHPSKSAVDHIMNAFSACHYSDDMQDLSSSSEKLMKALEHRPFVPETNAYKLHLSHTRDKLDELMKRYPELNWNPELNRLDSLWDQATRSTS